MAPPGRPTVGRGGAPYLAVVTGPHHDRRDGQECRSVLEHRCGDNADSQDYHVAPSGVRGPEAPPFT
jgi:hypothetical protein